jgi:hypothetical protein
MPSLTRVYDPAVFSPSEIAINRALDLVEAWVDRYLVTPLLGPDGSAALNSSFDLDAAGFTAVMRAGGALV